MMVPLYFAFPDGVFHYVCAECTALCCRRGAGFAGSLRREMPALLALYPALESMAVERRGDIITFATPAGGCHFLDGDNLCRIEKEHGKALKPGVCSLFPFNVFTRIGKAVAVSPHFMCPLRLQVPARPGQVEGTHAALEPAVRESALLDSAYLELRKPVPLHPSEDAEAVLTREANFRDLCSASLGRHSFSETIRGASADPARLDASIAQAAALLGLTVPSLGRGHDTADDVLLALAPALRLSFLQISAEGILLALALGELVLRRALQLSGNPLTPQGAHQIITGVLPALHLLACADEPVEVPRGAGRKVPPYGDPAMTFAGYRVLHAGDPVTGILDVLESAMRRLSTVADRTAFLVELGSRLRPAPPKRRRKQGALA